MSLYTPQRVYCEIYPLLEDNIERYNSQCSIFYNDILYPYYEERRDIRSNTPLRLKEFPTVKSEGTPEGERGIFDRISRVQSYYGQYIIFKVSLTISLYTPEGVYCEIYPLLGGNIERIKSQCSIFYNDILTNIETLQYLRLDRINYGKVFYGMVTLFSKLLVLLTINSTISVQ